MRERVQAAIDELGYRPNRTGRTLVTGRSSMLGLAAIGALRALRRHGLDVPADVAVIGWDAIELGASTAPSLTSVAPDTRALAERALDLLLDRLEGLTTPGRHVTVGHTILYRESAPELP